MKKHSMKWLAMLLCFSMIAVYAAGFTTAEAAASDEEPVTITFWHTYGDNEEAQFLNEVMPLWEAAHPEIKVEAVRQDSSQYHQMIVTSFGTGMSPDVARVDIANIAAYAKQGGLAALSDYADFFHSVSLYDHQFI